MSDGYRGGSAVELVSTRCHAMVAAFAASALFVTKMRPPLVPAQTTALLEAAVASIEMGCPAEVARVSHPLPVVADVDRPLVRAVFVDVAVTDPEVAVFLPLRVRERRVHAAVQRAEDVLPSGEHQLADVLVEDGRSAERHGLAVVAERCGQRRLERVGDPEACLLVSRLRQDRN